MKLLLATDGSVPATEAMETVLRLLGPEKHDIDILCVAPPWNRREESEPRAWYEEKARAEAARILGSAKTLMASGGRPVGTLPVIGPPAITIADKTEEYDLTVIGARGAGFRTDEGLGVVASRVLQHALGPVMIGRAMCSDEGLRILAAVDGSGGSLRALEIISMFDLKSAEVCLMYVVETPWLNLAAEGDWATASEEEMEVSQAGVLEKEFTRESDPIFRRALEIVERPHLAVSSRIEEGNPASAILSEAERGPYDVVILGATGNRDVKHRMLGSVSSRVAWEAPCSVLIVPEPGETG